MPLPSAAADAAIGWTIAWTGGWPIAIGLVLATVACARARALHPDRADRRALLGIFALALALRLLLGLWAPLHINGQGPLWIGAAAVRPAMLVGYGPGYPEVFAVVVALGRASPDVAIFLANAIASAGVPVLAFALGRIAGLARDRSRFAAALLLVDPIAVRFAATESYFVPIIVLVLAATVAVAAAVRIDASRRTSAVLLLAAAAMFVVQAARIHPAAWVPLAACPLAALLPQHAVSMRRRVVWLALASVTFALALATTSAGWLVASSTDALRYAEGVSGDLVTPVVLALVGIAFVAVRARHGVLVLLGCVALACDSVLRVVYGQSEAWQASFDRLYSTMPALAVAAVIPAALLVGRARIVVALALLVVTAQLAWPLRTPTTDQREYRWLRDELAALPGECRVASVPRADERVLYLPWYVLAQPERAPSRWVGVRNAAVLTGVVRASPCVVWVRASICASVEGRPLCDAIEDTLALEEIASIELPPVPSRDGMEYDVDVVRISISRARATATPTPAAPAARAR